MANLRIGTSGWQYVHWSGKFYPEEMKVTEYLNYYTTIFNTVEINSTFYHSPSMSTVKKWRDEVPDNFRYSVKLHRYLTHMKMLKTDAQSREMLKSFLTPLSLLGDKLHVILIQCPPRMRANEDKLIIFLSLILEVMSELKMKSKLAIEFRHPSWFNDVIYKILDFYKVGNVQSDGADEWPISYKLTCKIGYIRLHGSKKLYDSSYTEKELNAWKNYIEIAMKECDDIYVYFDNDGHANAPKNALLLKKLFTI